MSDDPGPMARFRQAVADPGFAGELLRKVAEGCTIREVAKDWAIPYRALLIRVTQDAELSEQCKRIRELAGIELRFEGLEIVDDATPETAPLAKLQADYREKLSRDLNRPLFGKYTHHEHRVTLDLGERLRRARERVIENQPERPSEAQGLGAVDSPAVSLGAPVEAAVAEPAI